ncbi:carbon-nitrogen hydrolase family protein [Alcaligenes sp. DN25]|uniref:carbon-nitrogen hydrolase family protein n=1 Tax=Alcaligenes TaxID=507 RepID=UPI0020302004|nr:MULTISPECIES: carbon-nitrogen hydrolase family protein [Alcaligenes]URW83070.1 carbon-nitrogen hydrolase family protein [Alcaligenes sp. DN25]WEA67901.1 carbon-nitrogen hydrolase family protein [Alcaligenes faecalis]
MAHYPKFKAAAIQAAPVYLNLDATVEKSVKLIEEAASNGAKLVAFPEAFIPGYPWFAFLGHPEYTRRFYHTLYLNAVEIPSEAVQKISAAARKNKIYVCISCSEKDGGSLYLAQLWFNPDGDLIGKHRKMRVSVAERLCWGDGNGSMMPVFETEIGNLGGLMCWEHNVPLDIAAMNSQNEQVHVAAWPGFFDDETASSHYAICNQAFVLMTSSIYSEEMKDMLCETQEERDYFNTFKSGHTRIYGPDGEPISDLVPAETEGIAYAEIDIEKIIDFKYYIDPVGHYSNQSLSMNFNQSPNPVVRKIGERDSTVFTYDDLNLSVSDEEPVVRSLRK